MPPLLFIHGAGHGAWCWDEHFTPWFRSLGFEAVALDLTGHGSRQERSVRWVPFSCYVEDVRGAAVSFDRPPVLVGHSLGALVVERYLSAGGRAAGLVLAAPVPHNVAPLMARLVRTNPGRVLRMMATLSFKPLFATPQAFAVFVSRTMPKQDIARLQARAQDESVRAFVDALLTPLAPPRPATVPTLLVAGSEDAMVTVAEHRRTAAYHSAELCLLPGIGHDLMLDVGWESAARRIDNFVRSLAGRLPA